MKVYRLARAPYAHTLSGIGAAFKGARWNSAGIEMIYTASNRSLAMAEILVHLNPATIPDDFQMITIDIPKEIKGKHYLPSMLPDQWNTKLITTQSVGDYFAEQNEFLYLIVPSVVVVGDFNVLINPRHSEFNKVSIIEKVKFPFDSRLFGQAN